MRYTGPYNNPPPVEVPALAHRPKHRYLYEEACSLEAPPEGYRAVEYVTEEDSISEPYPNDSICLKAKKDLAMLKTRWKPEK